MAPLKSDCKLLTTAQDKAEALNDQFRWVFTQELEGEVPNKGDSEHPTLPDIFVSVEGLEKLLSKMNPHKAAGPDQIRPNVMKELYKQIAPILRIIFQKSLDTGELPEDWKQAYVSPIFKKGEKYLEKKFEETIDYRKQFMAL